MRSPTATFTTRLANTLALAARCRPRFDVAPAQLKRLGRFITPILVLLALTTPACSSSPTTDDRSVHESMNPCPSGTLVDVDLPDVDVFEKPVCLVSHGLDEVHKSDAMSGVSIRPECSLNELHHLAEFGYYGKATFRFQSDQICDEGLVGCSKYNIYLRFPRLSNAWHLFKIRPPNRSCNYREHHWYWRFSTDEYLLFARFRANHAQLMSPIQPYRIEIFDKRCGNVSRNDMQKAIEAFSKSDRIIESLPSHETAAFLGSESHRANNTLSAVFDAPIIDGCFEFEDGFTWTH